MTKRSNLTCSISAAFAALSQFTVDAMIECACISKSKVVNTS